MNNIETPPDSPPQNQPSVPPQQPNSVPTSPPSNQPSTTPTPTPITQQNQSPGDSAESEAKKQELTNKLFPEDLSASWRRSKCLNCGYVHEGATQMTKCPKCGNEDPDKFAEAD